MTVSIRAGYVTKKNYLKAQESIKNGLVKAAGVTASGDVAVEIVSESTRKISVLTIDRKGKSSNTFLFSYKSCLQRVIKTRHLLASCSSSHCANRR